MLLACGSNGRGQLGLGHTEDVDQWTSIPLDLKEERDIYVVGGGNHTCIVNAGRAWLAGSGYSSFYEIKHPHTLEWQKCSAGWDFTVLVDDAGGIWVVTMGTNEAAKFVGTLQGITHIDSGMMHTVIGTVDGTLWGWGAARKGQLGDFEGVKEVPKLSKLPISSDVFACGRDYTILGSGAVLGRPWTIPASECVRSGWSFAGYRSNVWHFIGNNSHGQTNPPRYDYEDVALGSEHGLGVRPDRTVETWGWGEHGNCPSALTIRGEPSTIKVFGGCATSFIYYSNS